MRREDQERAIEEVVCRVLATVSEGGSRALEGALLDTLYHEEQRLKKAKPSRTRDRERSRYARCRTRMLRGSDEERKAALREVIDAFAREVLGNFNPTIHRFATRAVPFGLRALLGATSTQKLLRPRGGEGLLPNLENHVVVDGELDHARGLKDKGTLIFAPTHSSNLDSILLGWGLHECGFPPLLYGAGLNLFSNPVMALFMRNLGAYKVDRLKQAPIYKKVLKTYAQVSLELGYHNLFFPGGTRARGGAVEKHLKLGLLGTGLSAYISNLRVRRPRPKVYVVPVVLSYELVLEAETLVEDFLKMTGQARFIITDDEFASPRRILHFLKSILDLDTRIHVTLMPPLDPFGNFVDPAGESVDGRGRRIAIERYVQNRQGEVIDDPDRDREYTREVGSLLVDAYHQGNTVSPTHLVAFALFEELRRLNPDLDLYRLLRTGGQHESLPMPACVEIIGKLRDRLRVLADDGKIRLGERLTTLGPEDLLLSALKAFGTFHTRGVLERIGDRIYYRDRNLLYYYRNRLLGYDLAPGARV